MYSPDENEVKTRIADYVDEVVPQALNGYINEITTWSSDTNKTQTHGVGLFNETITDLKPGTIYYYKAWANNSQSESNGTQRLFLTKPDAPKNIQVSRYNTEQMNITWNKGSGAFYTIIERNKTGVNAWGRGEGIQIYNNTGLHFEDTNIAEDVRYYYQIWSYRVEKDLQQYSLDYGSIFTDGTPYLGLLVDSDFNDCIDSADLRADAIAQDWYESRNDNPILLQLDENTIGDNVGKKAKLIGNTSTNAYMSQEFSQPQTENFSVQWDIYIVEL